MKGIDVNTVMELKAGKKNAFNLVVDRYYHNIQVYFRQQIKRIDIANELTNDTFNRLWTYRENIDTEKGSLEAYIRKIAQRILIDWRKSERKEKNLMSYCDNMQKHDQQIGGEDEQNSRLDYLSLLDQLSKLLPEKRGQVFLMSRILGMSYIEIANELSISKSTVKDHLVKANKVMSNHSNEWK